MSSEKPFRKISELVSAMAQADQGLTSGTLGLDGLETACGDARELYERMVVLRHKAREAAVGQNVAKEPLTKPTASEGAVEAEKPVRLDTRPAPEVSPRQTSLIEAIESTEQEPTTLKHVIPKPMASREGSGSPPSVAEKLEKAAVGDLNKAITLSHKFWFVAELFNGDRINYEKAIEQLNGMAGPDDARRYIETEVVAKLKKPADPEALSTFTHLVQRRYA